MIRALYLLIACAAVAALNVAAADAPLANSGGTEWTIAAQTIVHMLDYVGVDYSGAVQNGKVTNADEFKEMVEFSGQIVSLLKELPHAPQRSALVAQAEALAAHVHGKAAPADVAADAGKLRWAVISAYRIPVAPKSAPDIRAGATLYGSLCASCHGAEGRGDGPASVKLDPVPSNFHDVSRMGQRSAYGLYNAISLGVAGTAMAPFKQLSEAERWALAFYVSGLRLENARRQGEGAWRSGKWKNAFPNLASVATLSGNEVVQKFGPEAAAAHAWLLAHPEALAAGKRGPIAFSIDTLQEASAAYRTGDKAAAQKLAVTAYLEGFELAEASLRNVDERLVREVEREMMALRTLIERGVSPQQVESQRVRVEALLGQAQARLDAEGLTPEAAFFSAVLILLREGLEAMLVLAAIFAFLVKARRRDALPYAHAGWGAALVLGGITWLAAAYTIEVSGADREITEGVTALIAAAMLMYVGFWLHNKAYAHAWQRFIRDNVGTALEKKTLWAITGVSFLAVYRELFEIVLFYQALWVQAEGSARQALLAGVGVAVLLLAATGWAIFRYSVRLPVGPFFAAMSVLLALMAVIFAGNGIAALQEAGVIHADPVAFITVPALGLHSTVQTIAAQVVVLLVVIGSFYLASRGDRDRARKRG